MGRVNTDLTAAVALLRKHHEDNWVGPVLERIWNVMLRSGDLMVFELWLLENDTERMVAADFSHPHSMSCVYVATRFFDRDYKTCMPGFILAFAEAEALARRGFDLWDLGGTNRSPMMQYKTQVALGMNKGVFQDHLHSLRLYES